MKKQISVFLFLVLLPFTAALSQIKDLTPYDFYGAVPLIVNEYDALQFLVIPDVVYENTAHADLRDIRIFNGNDEIVPFAFWTPEQHSTPDDVVFPTFPLIGKKDEAHRDMDLQINADSSGKILHVQIASRADSDEQRNTNQPPIGYLIDTGDNEKSFEKITLHWQNHLSFISAVSLESSDDLRYWHTVKKHVPIVSLIQDDSGLTVNTIDLSDSAPSERYWRILIDPDQDSLPMIDRWVFTPRAESIALSPLWKDISNPAHAGEHAFQFELPAAFPVSRLMITPPSVNTITRAHIGIRDTPDAEWRSITSENIYSMQQNGVRFEHTEIILPERVSSPYWQITFDARTGGVGKQAPYIRVGHLPQILLFVARNDPPFRLAYGNRHAENTAISAQTLLNAAPNFFFHPTNAVMTEEPVVLAGRAALSEPKSYKNIILWLCLIIAVLLMGWMAIRLLKQMREDPPTT